MTIRIFNPEHDLALASNIERFTAPHAGRQLHSDLCFLPALWSEDGDVVVVDDIDYAEAHYRLLRIDGKRNVEFCTMEQLPAVLKDEENHSVEIDAWGWDKAVRFQFLNAGVPKCLLPEMQTVDEIRRLSGRQVTTAILTFLRAGIENSTCGESLYVTDYAAFAEELKARGENLVAKAPWSSSGRGVRYFIEGTNTLNAHNWIRNVIRQQGGVMVEPLYNKVKDFGMEFVRHTDGKVHYSGLSLFRTQNGAYTGNILATEGEKREMLSVYLSLALIDEVANRLEKELTRLYAGLNLRTEMALGVDMMVVARDDAEGFLLDPCVEINLRRTMGHVALSVSPDVPEHTGAMAVAYEGKKYHLKISNNKTN